MDGWMGRWMESGWMDGWVGGWMNETFQNPSYSQKDLYPRPHPLTECLPSAQAWDQPW